MVLDSDSKIKAKIGCSVPPSYARRWVCEHQLVNGSTQGLLKRRQWRTRTHQVSVPIGVVDTRHATPEFALAQIRNRVHRLLTRVRVVPFGGRRFLHRVGRHVQHVVCKLKENQYKYQNLTKLNNEIHRI